MMEERTRSLLRRNSLRLYALGGRLQSLSGDLLVKNLFNTICTIVLLFLLRDGEISLSFEVLLVFDLIVKLQSM